MTRRTWCQVAFGVVFCTVAVPVAIGLVLLVAMIPGCNGPWGITVASAVLVTAAGWGLIWALGDVGAQWDRTEERR